MRTINDRVYGEIPVSKVASHLLSNPWLVRLDSIRQLGACSFVYPSATHTRREHSIGVYHLSGIMAEHIRTLLPTCITAEDVEWVRIAGLLHDVGHGPFSHMYESFWRDRGVEWSHEEETLKIVADHLMCELYDARSWSHTMTENYQFLTCLITGVDTPNTGRSTDVCQALMHVVHSQAGVDADRMDYLLRDTLCVFGSTHTVDAMRIIHSIRIVNARIAFDQKVSLSIQQLFELRTRLHKQVYQHRDVLVVEALLKEYMDDLDPSTFDDFGALTDASILAGAPLTRLHTYPRMHRVHLQLLVPTSPLCGACGHEFLMVSNFCPMCGTSFPESSSPPPVNLTSVTATRHVRVATGRPDLYILISDVTYGSLCDVPFHDMGRPYNVTDEGGRPLRFHLRKMYCFTKHPTDDDDRLSVRVQNVLMAQWTTVRP